MLRVRRDAQTGEPLEAAISVPGLAFRNGETRSSGGPFGRYFYWAGPGTQQITFTAFGYHPETIAVNFGAGEISRLAGTNQIAPRGRIQIPIAVIYRFSGGTRTGAAVVEVQLTDSFGNRTIGQAQAPIS